MPRVEDIEQFKSVLNTLGNEPEILEERGETLEEVPPPEEGLPDDLSALLDDTSDLDQDVDDQPSAEEDRTETEEDGSELPEEAQTEPAEEAPFEAEDFDFGEGAEAESTEEAPFEAEDFDFGEDVDTEPPEQEPETDTGEGEAESEPDEFNTEDMDELLNELGDLGLEDEEEPEPTTEEPEPGAETGEEPEPTTEEPEPTPEEEPAFEDFDFAAESGDEEFQIPDIDQELAELDQDFGAPPPSEPEEEEEEFSFEAPEPPEPTIEEQASEATFEPTIEEAEEPSELATDPAEEATSEPTTEPAEEEEAPGESEPAEEAEEPFEDFSEFLSQDISEEPETSETESVEELSEEDLEEVGEGEDEFTFDELPSDTFEEEGGFGEQTAPAGATEEGPEEEGFDLPDLDEEFSFEDETAAEEEATEEAASEPEEAPEESFEETEAFEISDEFPFDTEEEEFEIDTDEFDLGGGEETEQPGESETEESVAGEEEFEEISDIEGFDIEEPQQFTIPTEEFDAPESADDEAIPGEEDIDEFNLGDLGLDFEETDTEGGEISEEDLNPATAVTGELGEAEEGELEISSEDFDKIRMTLGYLPRNLKIAVEELIGERQISGDELKKLLNMLTRGESAKNLATYAGKLLDRKIEVPKQYEKKTGAEFEEEKQSFRYIFVYTILPALKVALAGAAVLGFLIFLGYRFVYRPVHAQILYTQGYEKIEQDEFAAADSYFDRAREEWEIQPWYYKYAQTYIDKNQYYLAEQQYDKLLARHPMDKRGVLEYARLESEILSNYAAAEQVLDRYLNKELYDYDVLLASGDNYMRWADEDPSQFENAREAYAILLERYGGKPEVLFRMLRYFIRTDQPKEVERLQEQFEQSPSLNVNPHVYAELGGYLLDKQKLEDVRDILFRALDADETVPGIHYHLSRYFRKIEEYGEEEKALQKALRYLKEQKPYSRREMDMLVRTHNRLGEVSFRNEQYIEAEQAFQKAKQLYEEAVSRNILGPSSEFGRIYANLGDIYYYISNDYDTAFSLYEDAERNAYNSDELHYKKGFILYRRTDYSGALSEFYESAAPFSENTNLLFSTGNTLYRRGDYFAAQGYYNHLLDLLEREKDGIPYLLPEEKKEHQSLLEMITKTYNNLGVTLYMLSDGNRDQRKYSESLRYLTKSTEFADLLSRNQETMDPMPSVQLSYLNMRSILYPEARNELQIYGEVPKDTEVLFF